jgi:hypothetical protein
MVEENFSRRSRLELFFAFILFLVSYGIIWFISTFFFSPNGFFSFSPMHWLAPIPAFFFLFWAFDWIEDYFNVRLSSWWFPVLVIILGLAVFWVNAWFYYCNGFTNLSAQSDLSLGCDSAGSQRASEYLGANWWNLFTRDAFFYFWLAIFFGWASRVIWKKAVFPAPVPEKKASSKKKKK